MVSLIEAKIVRNSTSMEIVLVLELLDVNADGVTISVTELNVSRSISSFVDVKDFVCIVSDSTIKYVFIVIVIVVVVVSVVNEIMMLVSCIIEQNLGCIIRYVIHEFIYNTSTE